jgi:hypothetical protein
MDNTEREKKDLEQEVSLLVQKDHNEMSRKRSIANINSIKNASVSNAISL